MIPALLGMGGWLAKVAAVSVIPKVVQALQSALAAPAPSEVSSPKPDSHVKYTFDQLGSVRELVDSSGAVRADYRYSTYGERTKVGGDLESDWGYAGLFHHEPSGLDLATYRTYDSTAGRWISRDPLGTDRTLYSYCWNNPISRVDPSGLDLYLSGGAAEMGWLKGELEAATSFKLSMADDGKLTIVGDNGGGMSNARRYLIDVISSNVKTKVRVKGDCKTNNWGKYRTDDGIHEIDMTNIARALKANAGAGRGILFHELGEAFSRFSHGSIGSKNHSPDQMTAAYNRDHYGTANEWAQGVHADYGMTQQPGDGYRYISTDGYGSQHELTPVYGKTSGLQGFKWTSL